MFSVTVINIMMQSKKNAKTARTNVVNVPHMKFAQDALIQLIINYQMGNALKNAMKDSIFKLLPVCHVILRNVANVFIQNLFVQLAGVVKFCISMNAKLNVQQDHLIPRMEAENV